MQSALMRQRERERMEFNGLISRNVSHTLRIVVQQEPELESMRENGGGGVDPTPMKGSQLTMENSGSRGPRYTGNEAAHAGK